LLVDEIFMNHLGELALREGDYLLGQIFYSLNEDCRWHREWAAALIRMAIEDNSDNRGTVQGWIEKWHPDAAHAVQAFAAVFDGGPESARMSVLDGIPWKLGEFYREYLARMSLRPERPP
jgi:toluene monooxygenase system protein E